MTWKLLSFQVLNKKSKFKKSDRREDPHNRTRDIYSLQELYPAQLSCHILVSSCIHLKKTFNCTSLTLLIKNQSRRRGGEPTGFLLYTWKGENALSIEFSLKTKKFSRTRRNLKWGPHLMYFCVGFFPLRALRNGLWPLLNTLSQKEVQLCWLALGSCCLLPVFHPGIRKRLTIWLMPDV